MERQRTDSQVALVKDGVDRENVTFLRNGFAVAAQNGQRVSLKPAMSVHMIRVYSMLCRGKAGKCGP